MTAQPIYSDPNDPELILARLPEDVRQTFLEQYEAAVQDAREPAGYRGLVELLHMWSLRADAYSTPGYQLRRREAEEAAASGAPGVSLDELIAVRNIQ